LRRAPAGTSWHFCKIEETAGHSGHVDLVREAIDRLVGD
jgi:hypothetical protein